MILCATRTEAGQGHAENQDRLAADPVRGMFVVVDGMGGLADGAATAQLIIDRLAGPDGLDAILAELSGQLNDAVRDGARRGPGTTGAAVALLLVRGGAAFAVHAGDSRIYLARDGHLARLTDDHTAAGQLTRFVGMPGVLRPEVSAHRLRSGDRLLVCTDGLTRGIDDDRLAGLLATAPDPDAACRRLLAAARAGASGDDIAVIVLEYREDLG